MSITVRFVGQSNGSATLGYLSQWRLDQEDRDPVSEARKIKHLNSSNHLAHQFNKFVTWDQYYSHEETKKGPDGESQTYLAGYSGSSAKQELNI